MLNYYPFQCNVFLNRLVNWLNTVTCYSVILFSDILREVTEVQYRCLMNGSTKLKNKHRKTSKKDGAFLEKFAQQCYIVL